MARFKYATSENCVNKCPFKEIYKKTHDIRMTISAWRQYMIDNANIVECIGLCSKIGPQCISATLSEDGTKCLLYDKSALDDSNTEITDGNTPVFTKG